jgi:hypothetical protein
MNIGIAIKKYLESLLLCTTVFVFGIGCSSSPSPQTVAQTPPASAYRSVSSVPSVPVQPGKAKVEILSEPAGARIEVNDDYVGDAPITVEIPQNSGYFTQETVIRALPTEAGDYVQSKHFHFTLAVSYGYGYGTEAKVDKIPSRIFFNMHLGPATPAVDVNVNPSN